jgi:hypothetical protein
MIQEFASQQMQNVIGLAPIESQLGWLQTRQHTDADFLRASPAESSQR